MESSPEDYWNLSTEQAMQVLSSTDKGLAAGEAARRLQRYGHNTLKSNAGSSKFILFLSQFKSPITILLIAAALLSMALGDFTNTVIILVIIGISSFLGFWQEKGAAYAIRELLKMVQIHCRLVRDGKENELPIEKVVPGDIVLLSAGDIIPGDSLLLEVKDLFVDEAAFTGESFPVEKSCSVLPPDTSVSKRSNSLFMGSHVISGKAKALVFRTGKATEFGKISDSLRIRASRNRFRKGHPAFRIYAHGNHAGSGDHHFCHQRDPAQARPGFLFIFTGTRRGTYPPAAARHHHGQPGHGRTCHG